MVIVISLPVVQSSQNGVIRKQSELVTMVTINATESLPPALRVQTAADASVQGIAAIKLIPIAKSPDANSEAAQAISGKMPALISVASIAANGRRMAPCKSPNANGNAIRKSTVTTMPFRNKLISGK